MKRPGPRIDKSVLAFGITPALRDRAYLDWLRTQPCIVTGLRDPKTRQVDPAHIGTAGKGNKSPDNEALPLLPELHREGHQKGEMTMFRWRLPDDVLRDALRALAREQYERWKNG